MIVLYVCNVINVYNYDEESNMESILKRLFFAGLILLWVQISAAETVSSDMQSA